MSKLRNLLGVTLSAALITLGIGRSSQAIVFNFGGNGSHSFEGESSLEFNSGGLLVTATGSASNGRIRNVTQRNGGLGVRRAGFFDFLDSPQIDGLGPDETLTLSFGTSGDQKVVLSSATFSKVDGNDEFTLLTDGETFLANQSIPSSGLYDFTSFVRSDRTASGFSFRATDWNDNYYLKSVDVERVPEPITVVGTFIAVGFGSLFHRKRSKSK